MTILGRKKIQRKSHLSPCLIDPTICLFSENIGLPGITPSYQSQRHQNAETDKPSAKGLKISPRKKKRIIISQDASAANNRNSIFGTTAPPTGPFGETLVQRGGHLYPFHTIHMLRSAEALPNLTLVLVPHECIKSTFYFKGRNDGRRSLKRE